MFILYFLTFFLSMKFAIKGKPHKRNERKTISMDNLITIFKQTDSDAEHIYNPNLIIGSQLAWRGLMHVRCTDLSLRSKYNLFSHQLLLETKTSNGGNQEMKRNNWHPEMNP